MEHHTQYTKENKYIKLIDMYTSDFLKFSHVELCSTIHLY